MTARRVILDWELSCDFGWGILAYNIFCHWANDNFLTPVSGRFITEARLGLTDPLRLHRIAPKVQDSNTYLSSIVPIVPKPARVDADVIVPVSHGFAASTFEGHHNIGRCVFEHTNLDGIVDQLAACDVLLCASRWNADLLRAESGRDVAVIHEGIDPSLFFPGPRSGLLDPSRFYVFSCGKVEYRKGQDLVLRAFREFSRRCPDATLVTAWHSRWPEAAIGFKGTLDAPLEADSEGKPNVKRWASENGVDPERVIEIFKIDNHLMPAVLREMDVALQPSRAEACTNLPAKEAMACGVPVMIPSNTGMLDLITEDNCALLARQHPVSGDRQEGTLGWGESDVDEIVETLEMLHRDHRRRKAIGATGAKWIHEHRTWKAHAHALKTFVLSLSSE